MEEFFADLHADLLSAASNILRPAGWKVYSTPPHLVSDDEPVFRSVTCATTSETLRIHLMPAEDAQSEFYLEMKTVLTDTGWSADQGILKIRPAFGQRKMSRNRDINPYLQHLNFLYNH